MIYLDFLGAAMDKRALVFFIFCLGVWLSACQMGPVQVNRQVSNGPQISVRTPPTALFQAKAGPAGAGFEQMGNTITSFNEKGEAEALFVIAPNRQRQTKPFNTKTVDLYSQIADELSISPNYYPGGLFEGPNDIYSIGFENNYPGAFITVAYPPWAIEHLETYNPTPLLQMQSSNFLLNIENVEKQRAFYQENPQCEPYFDIYLNDQYIETFKLKFTDDVRWQKTQKLLPNGLRNGELKIIRKPIFCVHTIENNQKKLPLIPIGQSTFSTLLTVCPVLDDPSGAFNVNGNGVGCLSYAQTAIRGAKMCSPEISDQMGKWAEQGALFSQKIEALRQDSFGNLDFQAQSFTQAISQVQTPIFTERQAFYQHWQKHNVNHYQKINGKSLCHKASGFATKC